MAFRDSLKKYREAQGSQTTSLSGTTKQSTSDTSGSERTDSSFSDTLKRYREFQSTSSLQGWGDISINLINDINNRSQNWYDQNEYTSQYNRISSQLSMADTWRKEYAGNDEAISYIDSVVDNLTKAKSYSYSTYQHYSKWDSADSYKQAMAEYEKQQKEYDALLHYDTYSAEQEIERYKGVQGEMRSLMEFIDKATDVRYQGVYRQDQIDAAKSRYKQLESTYGYWDELDGIILEKETSLNNAKKVQEEAALYNPAKNQEEGKVAWEEYTKYQEEQAQRIAQGTKNSTKEDKPWWLEFLSSIGNSGPDTTLPVHVNVPEMSKSIQDQDAQMRAPKENWTDEEKYHFGYLWKYNRQKSYDYAYAVNTAYLKQAEQASVEGIQAMATDNFGAGALHTAGAVLTSPLGLADYLYDLIAAGAVDNIPAADGVITPFEYSQAVTSGISQHLNDAGGVINEDIPIVGGKGWGDVYGLGTSIAQSSAAAYTGGSGQALITFFGSAAAAGVDDAINRGATNEQAILYGTSLGVAEALAEKIGIDNLFKIGSAATRRELIFNLLKQSGAEGIEEGFTNFLGNVADNVIMQEKSSFYLLVSEFQKQGMSLEDAKNKAWKKMWGDMAYDALGGFASGFVHAGSQTAIKTMANNATTKAQYGGSQQELVGEALEIDPDNAYAQKMQGRLDNGKNLSGSQLNKLIKQNEAALTAQDMADIQSAVESRLTKLGETGDVSAIAAAITKQATGKKLSKNEWQLVSGNESAYRILNELNPENIRSGEYSSFWAEKIDTQRINVEEYSRLVEADQQSQETAKVTGEQVAAEMSKEVLTAQPGAARAPAATIRENRNIENSATGKESLQVAEESYATEVRDDNKTIQISSGKEVTPQRITSISNGKAMIQTDNGKISSDDIAFGNEDMDLLWRSAIQFNGITPEGANGVIRAYQESIPVTTYLPGAAQEFKNGFHNLSSGGQYADKLTPSQRTIIYELGQNAAGKNTAKAQSNVDTVYAEAKKILEEGKAKKESYHAVLEDGISPMQLNKAQKATYRLADEIAQAVQTNIRVYEGKDKAQGFYNHTTDEIWLNLKAADTGRDAVVAFTLAHEIVHRSKKGSPAKYKAFANFLMKEYGKQGSDVEAMIAEQIAAAEGFNKTVPDSKKVNMTREKALEEVVCDACQRMLLDTNAGQKLAEFGAQSKQNKSFLEDLKRWIGELLDKLRRYFKDVEPDSRAAKEFAKFDANMKQILADMYVDMAIESGEKLSTIKAAYGGAFADKFLGLKDISYNLAAVDTHKAKMQKEYSEDSSTDLNTIMARYDKIIDIWTRLGGELNSKFLAEWNSKVSKDRTFTIFKAQAGYKYNVELSSMCKKGVPLFEAIDTIVKKEVMKELEIDVLGKAEKEILYDILKQHHFEIPCAICYVEQARQREGVIIDAFLNGKVETNSKGVTTKVKLGWNQVLESVEKEMKANGVNYSFAQVSRDIATEKYVPADLSMDSKTQDAFYAALKKIANQEIARYNKAEGKSRKLLSDVTPAAVKECFKGTLPANLNIFKVMFNESESLFKIQKDLLYSSIATQNLSMAHNKLYGLFNMQGGVSGYKTKQGTTIYWGDILGKSWKPDTLRNEGGVRNQSNSDFQMYTLLDQAQMYMDFTAKGYYLQAYTKVLSELKLFGLSRGKINASLIPKVVVYRNADGSVDIEKTMATAGLDENGNPIYDDIEGINHDEAFMLIEDSEYSKSICGICIGYSDAHINKLLDDNRVQQIIGFHDKTDDGTKRYKGARYAKNYNGLNEAVNKEGKTVHIGFNPYVKKAEKKFKFNAETETYEGAVNYNGKTYTADDIPRLAADLYLEMCAKKEYTPAYKDFAGHRNYYKLLADFGLYDSQGHYAPHRKVVYNMPDTVPYLDANGKKQTMSTYDYIKAELVKELTVRDSIAEALADTSDEGIIPQFKAAVKKSQEEKSYSLPKGPYSYETLISKPDMVVTTVGGNVPNNRADVAHMAKKNATKVGKFDPKTGSVSVHVEDVDTDVILSTKGLRHGLRRTQDPLIEPNYIVTVKTGEILKNSIRINEITPEDENANSSYVLIGVARDANGTYVVRFVVNHFDNNVTAMDVLYAINAKKELAALNAPRLTAEPLSVTSSTISIEELLNLVNQYFPDILPEEVLKHYGYDSRPDGDLGEDALYKLPIGEDTSPRALLANAFKGIITNDIEKRRLEEYKGKVEMLNAEEQKLHDLRAEIKELSFAKGKRDTKRIKDLQFEAIHTANRIATLDKILLRLEAAAPLQSILKREKEMAYKRAEHKGKEALEAYRKAERERDKQWQSEVKEKYQASKKKAIETRDKREAREKLQKLVIDTAKWISYPSKTDVKCPDILKQPYADFLNGIDLSSQRLAHGGDPTKNDLRLANAMSSLATALDKVMTSQDPTQETTAVLDTGYLDLPANFVQKLRDMTEDVKAMMGNSEYVVNRMPAEDVRKLTQMIRTLNHAIKEVSTLYANLRFANVEALGDNTMSFIDDLGEIEKTGGVKDFVQWDNALPYYAFKRFGEGGESIFEGLMDAQDKLAFLAQKIFDFQEKAWKGNEAKAWSEDTHTIDLPDGDTLTLTTADTMSIYCLSRRQQGLQHLLAGGIRVMGIQKGSKKVKDSRSLLTIKDIDTIISSLTDRQKQVAEAVQEFMSTVCSEWGNEISMKRFLTKEFNEKFYFPIESNDENLATKDPSAQQSDLFRLLNISATKPIDPRANNEVIIRNIFDVFSNHASDMARLNAYGMALLDYMKWFNYREKTVNEEGQINVRGVRKSMEKAFGTAARSYVLNLVKDVNGRASDGGLPSFYTKMLRNAKTAMVGSSLRVATLQITSYPRAALVLSPKNLALGLSKPPQIEKAKKYCGIALWKSFGFYDTNISRSVEEQIKGVKDVKQKLIELSLKGAEWGDAITWGALWNACEYEVASTKKYKVGTEEFYQAVGKKLREVVYRTQVVDSTLTRSEMMRSKNTKAQELSTFMSESTLSANIIMDAGFEFNMEKRRTKSIKAAWNKTGKYVTRAVAVYSVGQLAAAFLEGLWDAWRDDDDEEFVEKFLEAFGQNLVLDLLPFNKIPIISEFAEALLSQFGLGYFSSDNLSSTALTQTVSALKAWADVLNGKSSVTPYNAIYKSTRALSSWFGISVSGVMREGVAAWNNTAGAYDTTLKVRQYELSKGDLAGKALEAIIEGNDRQENSIRAEFSDDDSYQSEMRTAIKDRYAAGEIDYDTAIRYLVEYGGMEEIDAYWRVEEWMYENETGDDYAKYNEFFTAVQTGKNLKAVIKKYTDNGVSVETLATQITNHYKPLYIEMSNYEKAGIKGYLLNAFEQCGVTREDATKKIQYWEFLSEQPGSDLSQYQVADYYEFAKPAGISATLYTEYCNEVKGINGEDKKEKRMAVIHSLPISRRQKDALYYAEGWAKSKIHEAPWR